MTNQPTTPRDLHNGQYVHTIEAMCRCGHSLGMHTAASAGGQRDCIAGDFGHEGCDCSKFRKVRAPKK